MSKIGFLTDSCSDIPQELADKYGIEVVGFPINLDGVEYMERKDFTNDQFYQMMRDAQGVPTTAAITQLQFCDIYARYADEGYTDLVYLSINAGGSSTYNNAVKAMELLEEEHPGYTMKIQVIDSHTYSMPYGWYFCECARKVRNGGELAACIIADSVIRIIPGAIGDEASALTDCFQDNLLAPPVYTRPAEFNGWKVPDVLLSGNFARIDRWKEEQAWERTKRLRPDLLKEE